VRLVRTVWEDQRRFPLQIATVLSQQFAGHGLQFFKVNKTITHVSVARPHYLDMEATPVSEGVKRIVDHINANPKSTRRKLVEALAPSTVPAEPPSVPAAEAAQTPEQTAIVADLHWLIHQGHVIEFANGTLETAKKPAPRPPKPEVKPKAPASDPAAEPPALDLAAEAPNSGEASVPATESPAAEPGEPAAEVPAVAPASAAPPPEISPENEKQEFRRPGDETASSEVSSGDSHPTEAAKIAAEASVTQPE